jgi:hypothetical protein
MISHSGFHQRIIKKYQKGRSNLFRFPLMIFHKSALNILLRFQFHNRILVSSFMGKNTYNRERFFSWFKAERLKSVYDLNPMVSLNKPDTKALPLPQPRVARDLNRQRWNDGKSVHILQPRIGGRRSSRLQENNPFALSLSKGHFVWFDRLTLSQCH